MLGMHWGSKSNVKCWDVIKIAMDARLSIKMADKITK